MTLPKKTVLEANNTSEPALPLSGIINFQPAPSGPIGGKVTHSKLENFTRNACNVHNFFKISVALHSNPKNSSSCTLDIRCCGYKPGNQARSQIP